MIEPVESDTRLVCFALADHTFGVPIESVKEAVALRPITPVFLVPDCVRGIMNLRGEIVVVLDLLRLLGFREQQISEHSRVVIIHGGGRDPGGRAAGLLADSLCGVVHAEQNQIQPPPATLPPGVSMYIHGVISSPELPLMILDLERIFSAEPLSTFQS